MRIKYLWAAKVVRDKLNLEDLFYKIGRPLITNRTYGER